MSDEPIALRGDAAEEMLARWGKSVRGGRLNHRWPPPRALRTALKCMRLGVSLGLREDVHFDQRTLLPTYREWTVLQADAAIAERQLDALGSRAQLEKKAQRRGRPVDLRLLDKWDYYDGTRGAQLPGLDTMSVRLRRHEPQLQTVHVTVVFDKHDASGLFVRYTIELSQRDTMWGETLIHIDEREHTDHSDALRGIVYRYASTNAEMTLIKLSEIPGIDVQAVHRGVVGPAFGALNMDQAPSGLREALAEGGRWVATFGLESAARDIASTTGNDPLRPLTTKLDPVRRKVGYRLYRDRKFVTDAASSAAARAYCDQAGTRNVIYEL